MRRTILSEDERSRILNLHKKAILVENPPQVSTPNNLSPEDADKYEKFMGDIKGQMGGDLNNLSKGLENLLSFVKASKDNPLKNAIVPELEKIYQETQQMLANPKN